MEIEIRSQNIKLKQEEIDFIRRCLGVHLGRFSEHVRRVTVRVRDENGPRGGEDHLCKIEVVLHDGERCYMETKGLDLYSGIHYLAKRTGRSVKRLIAKKNKFINNLSHKEVLYGT